MEMLRADMRVERQKSIYADAQSRLVDSAIELLNEKHNGEVNLTSIAKKANVSVATAYNHFPDNMLSIYGEILKEGFLRVKTQLENDIRKGITDEQRLERFLEILVSETIALQNAARVSFLNANELHRTGNWFQNEPFSFFKNLSFEVFKDCENLKVERFVQHVYKSYNGCLFLWIRYDSTSEHWSQFTDDWFYNEMKTSYNEGKQLLLM